MYDQSIETRLDSWFNLRKSIENSENPLHLVWDFFLSRPFIPYNKKINPYNEKGWPSPWEIIADNHYDDFTKALMIAWTLKLTNRFKNSVVLLKTMVDNNKKTQYNLVYIDNSWVINYSDYGPVLFDQIPSSFEIENIIEVRTPR
jgi:hypothetical protein